MHVWLHVFKELLNCADYFEAFRGRVKRQLLY